MKNLFQNTCLKFPTLEYLHQPLHFTDKKDYKKKKYQLHNAPKKCITETEKDSQLANCCSASCVNCMLIICSIDFPFFWLIHDYHSAINNNKSSLQGNFREAQK